MTALHDASKYGHADCVRLLINAGANINLQCSVSYYYIYYDYYHHNHYYYDFNMKFIL